MQFDEQLMSENIADLATALAKAQGEFSIANKDKKNPFFKSNYADFESVVLASRPALTKHGLSVVQSIYKLNDGNSYLLTVLLHSSGQWMKSKAQHNPSKGDVQSLSSYNTYLKRMCYTSLIGVVTGEYDDDGESSVSRISHSQKQYILENTTHERQDKIKSHYGVSDFAQLTESEYTEILAIIQSKSK